MVTPSAILEDPKTNEPPAVWPPDDEGGGGGGGGSGSGGQQNNSGPPVSAARLAVVIFCASVVMLFAGILSALVILRRESGAWPPPDAPTLVRDLWISTGFIVASSLAGFWAMIGAKPERRRQLTRRVALTWILGLGFCVSQMALWNSLLSAGVQLEYSANFTALFYMITALHVLHVFGGMIFLAKCYFRGRAGVDFRDLKASCGNCMIYWHFVGVVWYVLFAFLHSK
ncbi:MAG: cytochrome c oxidase subunit 3 [Planctomycetota bacterium]|jgi:cytochrome c oxidase subunit 3